MFAHNEKHLCSINKLSEFRLIIKIKAQSLQNTISVQLDGLLILCFPMSSAAWKILSSKNSISNFGVLKAEKRTAKSCDVFVLLVFKFVPLVFQTQLYLS